MTSDKSRWPLRRIVNRDRMVSTYGDYTTVLLECGHTKHDLTSQTAKKRTRCEKCSWPANREREQKARPRAKNVSVDPGEVRELLNAMLGMDA